MLAIQSRDRTAVSEACLSDSTKSATGPRTTSSLRDYVAWMQRCMGSATCDQPELLEMSLVAQDSNAYPSRVERQMSRLAARDLFV